MGSPMACARTTDSIQPQKEQSLRDAFATCRAAPSTSKAKSGCATYAFSSQVSPARKSLARSPLPFLA